MRDSYNEFFFQVDKPYNPLFIDFVLSLGVEAVEEKNGGVFVRSNDDLSTIAWAVDKFGASLTKHQNVTLNLRTNLSQKPNKDWIKEYKKGAARIAYYSKAGILPVLVGGNDKYGLGKHDPFWSYNHTETYVYDFSRLPEINIDEYVSLSETIVAKRLTDKMEEVIYSAVDKNDTLYVTNRDKGF